jgi:polar amino acid transport system permease protein
MNTFASQFFNLDVMRESFPYLLKGLLVTLGLTAALVPLGLIAGLTLALASMTPHARRRGLVRTWVNVFRAMPPLVLIVLLFSALPFVGIRLSAMTCVILGLLLNNASYYCEIFRAGLGSVPSGQREAGVATGLNRIDTLRFVVLPQAVRTVLPDLISNSIEVMKGTSLAAIVSVSELLHVAGNIRVVTYNTSPLTLAALMYLAILLPAVHFMAKLERKA